MGDEYVDYVRVYSDNSGEYRWTAYSNNGKILADSGEGFKLHSYALQAAHKAFPSAKIKNEEAGEVK